jgi:hypothetical protein
MKHEKPPLMRAAFLSIGRIGIGFGRLRQLFTVRKISAAPVPVSVPADVDVNIEPAATPLRRT